MARCSCFTSASGKKPLLASRLSDSSPFRGSCKQVKSICTFYSREKGRRPPTKAETRTNVLKEKRRVLQIDFGGGILVYGQETYSLGIGNGRLQFLLTVYFWGFMPNTHKCKTCSLPERRKTFCDKLRNRDIYEREVVL